MSRTKRDSSQINQFEHDAIANSKRVTMVNTEMAIELDADDGDSVTSHPTKMTASTSGLTSSDNDAVVIVEMDCSSMREVMVQVDGTGSVSIEASPSDTEEVFYTVGTEGIIYPILARRVRVRSTNVVGDVYLVGRS